MNYRWITIVLTIACSCLAAWQVEIDSLFAAFQPATVALSIVAAAVLVRLNRGMPTLDWKALDPAGRKRLTEKIVELQKDYLSLLAISTVFVGFLIYLVIVTPQHVCQWTEIWRRIASGFLGASVVLVLLRMALIVWRDYDIVKLQKVLIDAAADKEYQAEQEANAVKNALSIKDKIRSVSVPDGREWD